mmetsp:Transcript_41598/g.69195  ORF Transcript_41598/g.69195 Transcript_41598/m.69195 type:complete len:274 (-) Transcript_41598:361-1182(-)
MVEVKRGLGECYSAKVIRRQRVDTWQRARIVRQHVSERQVVVCERCARAKAVKGCVGRRDDGAEMAQLHDVVHRCECEHRSCARHVHRTVSLEQSGVVHDHAQTFPVHRSQEGLSLQRCCISLREARYVRCAGRHICLSLDSEADAPLPIECRLRESVFLGWRKPHQPKNCCERPKGAEVFVFDGSARRCYCGEVCALRVGHVELQLWQAVNTIPKIRSQRVARVTQARGDMQECIATLTAGCSIKRGLPEQTPQWVTGTSISRGWLIGKLLP